MKIGFIGLGNVGAKLAGSLLRNGFDLMVRDLDRGAAKELLDQGASWGESGQEMAEQCEVVITCLPSPMVSALVMEEAQGVLAGMGPGKIWLEMSSTDADEIQRLGAMVEARGAIALDCPVSGGCHRAATGNIAIFAGGKREAFDKVLPLLTTIGRNILHTGALGSASIMKVATNYLAGVQLISTGEAFMVAKKAGIDLGVAYAEVTIDDLLSKTVAFEPCLGRACDTDPLFGADHFHFSRHSRGFQRTGASGDIGADQPRRVDDQVSLTNHIVGGP